MAIVVQIKFSPNGRTYFYDAQNFENLKKGQSIIADFNDCDELGIVVLSPYQTEDEKILNNIGKIKRLATEEDQKTKKAYDKKSKEAAIKVLEGIKKFELLMKLVEVRYSFDGSKIFISYIAENRVDFRELVKYLASIFRTRVELRQISTREEAKMYGGLGICGKELCCSKFLNDNTQVTIKMAKAQGMALNPSKINGICGKLMCCLSYEAKDYQEALEKLPPLGTKINTTKGEGVVIFQDLLNEKVSIKIGDGENEKIEEICLSEIKEG